MRLRLSVLLALLFVSWVGPASAQQIKDPAAVLPETTLAYVELRQPGPLMKEAGGLIQSSCLGNMPDSLARLHLRPEDLHGMPPDIMGLGVMLSPEIFREAGRIEGVAFALTGLSGGQDGRGGVRPEFVVIILPGGSNVPGWVMRSAILAEGSEVIGEVEGVRLYLDTHPSDLLPPSGAGEGGRREGRVLARMPGVLLLGSLEAVKDVIRRSKGKVKEHSLADAESYQQASKWYGKEPGLFSYSNVPATMEALGRLRLPGQGKQTLELLHSILNPKAITVKATALTLQKGVLDCRTRNWLDPKEKARLLEVLPTTPLKEELLHFAPRDALLFAALSNGEGAKRWDKVVDLLDEVAKSVNPDAPPPSRQIGQLESKLDLKLDRDILGKIAAVGVAVPGRRHIEDMLKEKSGTPPMVVLVQGTDEDAADSLARQVLPRLVGVLSGKEQEAKPEEKEVEGQKVSTLEVRPGHSLCYGRQGDTLVLSPDPKLVAESLNAGAKKEGLLEDKEVAAEVKRLEGSVALVVAKPANLGALLYQVQRAGREMPVPGSRPAERREPGKDGADRKSPEADKHLQELHGVLEHEEPLTMSVTSRPEHITLDLRYPGLETLVPRLTDALVKAQLQDRAEKDRPRPVPVPPPTPPTKPETDR